MKVPLSSSLSRRFPTPRPAKLRAFSLIELLAVMLIIGLVAAFAVPAASTVLKGNDLTQAGQLLSNQIALGRQEALSLNRPVEVRFYKAHDTTAAGTEEYYQSLQRFVCEEDGSFKPLGKVQRLPSTILMDSSDALSPLISKGLVVPTPASTKALKVTAAKGFRFLPDGSTNLAHNQIWFLTAHGVQTGEKDAPPPNFFTVQVDPSNGNIRYFRP